MQPTWLSLGGIRLNGGPCFVLYRRQPVPTPRFSSALMTSISYGAGRLIDAQTNLVTNRIPVGIGDVIFSVYFVEVAALASAAAGRDDDLLGARYDIREVLIQFGEFYFIIAPDNINFAIVIKKHRQVVQRHIHFVMLPGAVRIGSEKNLSAVPVDICKNIKLAVMVTKARRPDALPVCVPPIFQAKLRAQIQFITRVAQEFPIDQTNYRFENGYMHIDDTPGIGVDLDEARAQQYPYQLACLPVNRKSDGTMFYW